MILVDFDNLGCNLGMLLMVDVGGFVMGFVILVVFIGLFGILVFFLVIVGVMALCLLVIVWVYVIETVVEDVLSEWFALDLLRIWFYIGVLVLGVVVFLMIGTFDALWVLVLLDLRVSDWIVNLGIMLFVLLFMVLGFYGGWLV